MNKYCLLTAMLTFIITVHAQFREGYYYDKENNKVTGFIKLHYGTTVTNGKDGGYCEISFKPTEDSKSILLNTIDMNSFVIGTDSFALIKDFYVDDNTHFKQDFAEVIEAGKLNLYKYNSTVNFTNYTKTIPIWLIGSEGKIDYVDRKFFKSQFADIYVSDYPELVDRINKKDLKYGDLKEIVHLYNEHFKIRP